MQMTSVFSTNKIENVLNKEFSLLCQWYLYSKLPFHFGEDKNKFILFSKARGLWKTDISFAGHPIKQHETVEYQKFQGLQKKASKALKKINATLKSLYGQSRYLTPAYKKYYKTR